LVWGQVGFSKQQSNEGKVSEKYILCYLITFMEKLFATVRFQPVYISTINYDYEKNITM